MDSVSPLGDDCRLSTGHLDQVRDVYGQIDDQISVGGDPSDADTGKFGADCQRIVGIDFDQHRQCPSGDIGKSHFKQYWKC